MKAVESGFCYIPKLDNVWSGCFKRPNWREEEIVWQKQSLLSYSMASSGVCQDQSFGLHNIILLLFPLPKTTFLVKVVYYRDCCETASKFFFAM